MAIGAAQVWQAVDVLESDRASELSVDALDELNELVNHCRVEQYERLSVDGSTGANPKCLEFQRHFEEHKYRFFAASGSNQSSKTVTVGGLCFCKHLRDKAENGDVYWVISQTWDTMRDIPHKTMWEFLPKSMFPKNISYSPRYGFGLIPTLLLTLPDGRGTCEIWFRNEEQDIKVFESARINGAWWTECRREQIFDSLQPRMVARRGWLLMDYIPVEAWHKFRIRIPAETGSNTIYHMRYAMKDNEQNLAPNAIAEARENMTEREARVRIDGEDGSEFGIVYMEFDPKRHVIEPFPIPPEWPRFRCFDYGYRAPSACLWVTVAPDDFTVPESENWSRPLIPNQERLCIYREYYLHGQTVPQIAGSIKAMSEGEQYRGDIIADPSLWNQRAGPGTSLADEFYKVGMKMVKAPRTQKDGLHAQVAKVRLWFENDKILMFNTVPNCIREHQTWRYKEDKDGNAPGNEPFEDGNDHAPDSLRYLLNTNPTHHKPSVTLRNYAA